MGVNSHIFFVSCCVLVLCISSSGVHAFGAGNIPSFAYLEGRAFRHGDIEDTLSEVAKKAGGFALGAIIGKGGSKFGGLDIKRVYFGNWLRDYSQAVDVAGLQKLPLQTILNLCMALGFLAHGYATHEFEVTAERLGCYLPTEHIDNPKGYPSDARQYDSRLRGPVDPRELEVDPRTGMKNYIANENGSWDTSKALARRVLERCIHVGRQHRAEGRKEDLYEAYRLLGTALHTLEDFAAHSNFCELALVYLGHTDVFLHVGDQVRIPTSQGKHVAPLVTGTFGGQDFIHSLLGEAGDHISQASVSDLNKELEKARAKSGPSTRSAGGSSSASDRLRELLFNIPGGGGSEMAREMDEIERIRAGPEAGGKAPDQLNPQELHAVLWRVLTWRDSIMKKIEKTIERIPGLSSLIEKLTESISVFVFTTLEPFLKPLMKTATEQLMAASGQVINQADQYEVFNDPRASDPTHSFLSKDHFNLILNEPAGNLGKIILNFAVTRVVGAWDDNNVNVRQVLDEILACLFHPDFHDRNSPIQRAMMEYMQKWVQELGNKQHEILGRLTKDAVRNHRNIRLGGEGGASAAEGTYAVNAAHQAQQDIHNYANQLPIVGSAIQFAGKMHNASGYNQPPGHTYGLHGHSPAHRPSGLMESIPGLGEAQSFIGQFGGGGPGRRDINEPGYTGESSYTSSHMPSQSPSYMPPTSLPSDYHPGGEHPSFPGGDQPSFPSGDRPSFPGGPPAPSSYGGSSYPGGHAGYAPSYAPPAPSTNYSAYASPSGPPPAFPGGPSYPGGGSSGMPGAHPTGGMGMPGANPTGGPSFPGADSYGGFGYNDPPQDRPFGY
ncbi:heterokaryon incompatibility protein Het-C-domain-containing protein [Cytidiella melzeri]|nr:heterokaryon incompatibility protein Het-C-domain-containing protein [Cytidiella melzeri]